MLVEQKTKTEERKIERSTTKLMAIKHNTHTQKKKEGKRKNKVTNENPKSLN